MAYDIGPKIGIEGEAEFRKQINDINTTMKTLATEMKLVSSQFVGNEKSVEAYAKKNGVLSKEITTQKEKLILLQQGLQKSAEKYGEADSRTQKWQQAVNNATAELNRMQTELKENIEAMDKLNSSGEKLKDLGKNISTASDKIKNVGDRITNVGKTVSVASAAVSGIGIAAIKTAADFESSMSQVAATMGMTAEEINNGSEDYKKLEAAAREMGSATQFSATEAAEALNYLALAGYDTDKSIETLPTILNLAAAGGIELGAASDMVTDAMSALGDKAGTAESFVDKMAKTSQKSNTSVAQLGEAILTVGGTAKSISGGVDEMNTVLGLLADNGIKGAEGGTALRNVILSLTAPTDKAAAELEALGVSALDMNGDVRPLKDIFGDLNAALGNMAEGEKTQVLNNIFNKVDLKSVNALLGTSAERFDDLKSQIEGSEGAAATMAETMNNNLNGAITSLKSALSEAAISIGQELLPIIKNIADFIKELVGRFNELSPEVKQIIVAVGAVITALGPLIVVIGTIVSSVGAVAGAIGSAVGAIGGLIAAINPVSIAIAAIVATIAVITAALINLYQTSETFRNTVTTAFQVVKDSLSNAFNKIKETISPLINAVSELGASFIDFYENSPIKDIIALIATFSATNAGTIISTAINLISTAFSSLVGVLTGAMSILSGVFDILSGIFTLDFNKIIEGLQELGEGIVIVFSEIIKGMVGIGENIVKGLLEGISNVASNIKSWIKERVTDPLINNIKEFFGIASPSKVMEEIGGFIMEGLLNGIIALKDKVLSVFEEIKNNILAVFTVIKDTIISAMTFIKNTIIEILKSVSQGFVSKLKEIKDNVLAVFTWIKDTITNTLNNIFSIWQKIWLDIGNIITNAVNTIKTAVGNIKTAITETFNRLIDSAFSWGANLIGGFVDGIKSMIKKVKDVVSDITDTVADFIGFHSPAKKGEGRYIVDWGQNMVGGFLDGVRSAMNEVRGTAGMLSQTMGENLYPNSNSAVAAKGNVNITINVGSVRNDSDIQAINSALNKTISDYRRALGVV